MLEIEPRHALRLIRLLHLYKSIPLDVFSEKIKINGDPLESLFGIPCNIVFFFFKRLCLGDY